MQLLIFDLDGTLIDSQLDIANSVNATRANLNLAPLPNELIYSYVGHGAPVLIRRAIGPEASDETVAAALAYFLAHYAEHMLDHTALYPGVRQSLDVFRDRAIPMAVLTNKMIMSTEAIIDGLGLRDYFFRIYGGNSFEQKKPDPVGIDALRSESGASRERSMMVGDSSVDIRTARNAGVQACGVTYGFQPESLQQDPPDYLLQSFEELVPIVISSVVEYRRRE
jgi:phosphoglycolate phosphatase